MIRLIYDKLINYKIDFKIRPFYIENKSFLKGNKQEEINLCT